MGLSQRTIPSLGRKVLLSTQEPAASSSTSALAISALITSARSSAAAWATTALNCSAPRSSDVDGLRAPPFIHSNELNCIALGQAAETFGMDVTVVHKDVISAVTWDNKAKSLLIEPLLNGSGLGDAGVPLEFPVEGTLPRCTSLYRPLLVQGSGQITSQTQTKMPRVPVSPPPPPSVPQQELLDWHREYLHRCVRIVPSWPARGR